MWFTYNNNIITAMVKAKTHWACKVLLGVKYDVYSIFTFNTVRKYLDMLSSMVLFYSIISIKNKRFGTLQMDMAYCLPYQKLS